MIYLVRHGETAWNLDYRCQGHSDSPLTERGLAQAAAAGRLLGGLTGDGAGWSIVSSPLGRAKRTAWIIAGAAPFPLNFDDRLKEVCMGQWEGMSGEEIDHVFPGARDGLGRYGWWFAAPGGETLDQLANRLRSFLKDAGDRPLIVVTHGVASRVLRGLYLKADLDEVLSLEVPQDAVFRLADGKVERIDCEE